MSVSGSNPRPRVPVVAVTMGDPYGIGAEITVKALSDEAIRGLASYRIYGVEPVLTAAASQIGITPFWTREESASDAAKPGSVTLCDYEVELPARLRPDGEVDLQSSVAAGECSLRFCEDAIKDAKATLKGRGGSHSRIVDAVVTAPICK